LKVRFLPCSPPFQVALGLLVNEVLDGKVFVIEKQGRPVTELRPLSEPPKTRRLPNIEAIIVRFPRAPDSGKALEEDR
jgi:antitoxin (DNA-binding transcriptional repressor) of toxin-antitoxin stability system